MTDKPTGEIVIYRTEDGKAAVDVRLQEDTVWLTQAQFVTLFKQTKQNVSLHIRNIFKEGELRQESVVKKYLTTARDGKHSPACLRETYWSNSIHSRS